MSDNEEEKIALKAAGTKSPNNRFEDHIYARISDRGTLEILDMKKRRAATHKLRFEIEYPTYEVELEIRRRATVYDERFQVHYTDFARLTEERVRHCLVKWDLHSKLPGVTKRLHRKMGTLEDDSMEQWKNLPPLLRKAIAYLIDGALGPP